MEHKKGAIHKKVSAIKAEVSKLNLTMSGHNKFVGFDYLELKDFLPALMKLQHEKGVDDTFTFDKERASLTLTCVETGDSKTVSMPFVEAEMLGKGGAKSSVDAIQRMGATATYFRRFLYLAAYGIVESDMASSQEPKAGVSDKKNKVSLDLIKGRIEKRIEDEEAREAIFDYLTMKAGAAKWDDIDFNKIPLQDFVKEAQKAIESKVSKSDEGVF